MSGKYVTCKCVICIQSKGYRGTKIRKIMFGASSETFELFLQIFRRFSSIFGYERSDSINPDENSHAFVSEKVGIN